MRVAVSTLAVFGCLFVALLLVAVLVATGTRSPMVSFEFKECGIEIGDNLASGESLAALKQQMDDMFRVVTCPLCGGKTISGAGVTVYYCRIRNAVQNPKECCDNIARFRICRVVLQASSRPTVGFMGFERQPGILSCSSSACNWTVSGPEGDSSREVSIVGMFESQGEK